MIQLKMDQSDQPAEGEQVKMGPSAEEKGPPPDGSYRWAWMGPPEKENGPQPEGSYLWA